MRCDVPQVTKVQPSSSGAGAAPSEAPVAEAEDPAVEATQAAPLNLADMPEALSATLQHIVGQLDVLTQTMALMEERVSMTEDKLKNLEGTVVTALDAMATAQMTYNDPRPA